MGEILITGHCTDVEGCVSTALNSSTVICVSCNTTQRLVAMAGECGCEAGYQLVNASCTEVCGDGTLVDMECDDGNSVNGDGCDSQCIVEERWSCSGGSSTTVSNCTYIGSVIFNMSSMNSTDIANEGVFTL